MYESDKQKKEAEKQKKAVESQNKALLEQMHELNACVSKLLAPPSAVRFDPNPPSSTPDPAWLESLSHVTSALQTLSQEQTRMRHQLDAQVSTNTHTQQMGQTAASTAQILPAIVQDPIGDFAYGPDTFTGTTNIYGINATFSPKDVLEALCPRNIPQDAVDAIGELLPDVGAMPGTFLSFADATNSELTDKLGTMLTLLNNKFKGGQDYGIITDKQWRSVSRTQLHEKCQEEKFDSMLDLFNEMEAEYHTNFKTSLPGLLIICNAGTKDQIQTFVSAGRIFQIFAGSLCLYKNLLLKIQ